MRRSLIVVFCVLINLEAFSQFASQNIYLTSNWSNSAVVAEPTYGIKYNGIWGWVDPVSSKEYAIIGSTGGTFFIDVTDPNNPIYKDYVAGRRGNCIWREFKTYGNYAYMVSDDAQPNSLQIVDLSYLANDSVHLVYDSDSIFSRAHTIYVDNGRLYCGYVHSGSDVFSMAVYSLANPVSPQLLRTLNQDYTVPNSVHDMFVRNDTVYASGGYDGLYIYRYDPVNNNFTLLNSLTSYPDQGYNHSSYLTDDGKTLVLCDEVPANLGIKVLDVSDLSNIQVLSTFKSNEGATPHNPYILRNHLIMAYYKDGIQIFDISDPSNPVKSGYFDTYPQNGSSYTGNAYAGCWGAYPYFPSGNLLASDMQNGLFILDASNAIGIEKDKVINPEMQVFPNPFANAIRVSYSSPTEDNLNVELFDFSGKKIFSTTAKATSGLNSFSIATDQLSSGIYFAKITGANLNQTRKLIKN